MSDYLVAIVLIILIMFSVGVSGTQPKPVSHTRIVKHRKYANIEYKRIPPEKKIKTTISQSKKDAIMGLRSLGFDKDTATMKIIIQPDGLSTEDMIKRGLQ